MNRFVRAAALVALVACAGGCVSQYQPLGVDASTGLYDTSTEVDPGGVARSKTHVDPADFGAVLVLANSNYYPSHLEFTLRRTLVELGYRNVVNLTEWKAWASDRGFAVPDEVKGETIKEFSARVKPVLIVDMRHLTGGERVFTGLRVVDGRTLEPLLTVTHPRFVWTSIDKESIYPVLNELRKWQRDVTRKAA